jgi:hypothetical protein
MKKILFSLLLVCTSAFSGVTDLKIGTAQIFNASYTGFTTFYNINARHSPGFSDGVTVTQYTPTLMEPIKASQQYFKLAYTQGAGVNDFSLSIHNQDGTRVKYVSYSGKIAAMADGMIHYKSNDQYDVFIFPNAGYATGTVPTAERRFNNAFTPTTLQLVQYTPPGDNTPIYTAGQTVPLGGGLAGGAATPVYTSNITAAQSTEYNTRKASQGSITAGNKIYLEEKAGTSGSIVNIEQSGFSNTVRGVGGGNAVIDGTNNKINIKQGSGTGGAGRNLIEFNVKGISNDLTIFQARGGDIGVELSGDSNNHYAAATVNGSGNLINIRQSSNSAGHYASTTITGGGNELKLRQFDGSEKRFWGVAAGNSNVFDILQQGSGAKYLDVSLNGQGNKAVVRQDGNGAHRATINLTNAGGPSTVTLTQQGGNIFNVTTGQSAPQVYNITQSCVTASGCFTNVTQGN